LSKITGTEVNVPCYSGLGKVRAAQKVLSGQTNPSTHHPLRYIGLKVHRREIFLSGFRYDPTSAKPRGLLSSAAAISITLASGIQIF